MTLLPDDNEVVAFNRMLYVYSFTTSAHPGLPIPPDVYEAAWLWVFEARPADEPGSVRQRLAALATAIALASQESMEMGAVGEGWFRVVEAIQALCEEGGARAPIDRGAPFLSRAVAVFFPDDT